MQVYIGTDHRGFELKQHLVAWLSQHGHVVDDCGNSVLDPQDDFVDFAAQVGRKVAANPASRGIVICGSGAGVVMAANKIAGVRCSLALNVDAARHAHVHEKMNVLALASDYQSKDEAEEYIAAFLNAEYAPVERFERRLAKLAALESNSSCH